TLCWPLGFTWVWVGMTESGILKVGNKKTDSRLQTQSWNRQDFKRGIKSGRLTAQKCKAFSIYAQNFCGAMKSQPTDTQRKRHANLLKILSDKSLMKVKKRLFHFVFRL